MKRKPVETVRKHHVEIPDDVWELLLARCKQEMRTPTGQASFMLRALLTDDEAALQ